jgi:hypothetical protein
MPLARHFAIGVDPAHDEVNHLLRMVLLGR